MVAFDSSSPTHQPPGCWSSSSRALPFSTAVSSLVSSSTAVMPFSARAAATPLRTAASIVAGQSDATQAPARTTFGLEVRIVHRSLRVPGRAAKVARGSRLTRDQSNSAAPSRSVSASAIRSTNPRPRTSSRSGTPLETTVRYWPPSGGEWPVSAPRSKTQWAGLSSRAASRWWRIGRSKSRWTLTIGESSSAGGSAPSSRAASAPGRATITASESSSSSVSTRDSSRTSAPVSRRASPAASPCIAPSGSTGSSRSPAPRPPSRAVCTVKIA